MDLSRLEVRRAPPAVDIDVEELVLIGFPPIDRHAVAEALQRELSEAVRLLSGTRPWTDGAPGPVVAGSIELTPEASAAALGASVARTVARSLLQ